MSLSHSDIDHTENEVFQERGWRVQPWAWVVIVGLMGLAAVGYSIKSIF